ncbi:uncharacterized protein LOC105691504 [Athalia rosae]|uniref:uncharacterized protein LOC105691504 n=1 Tax=Athalia rosae TaxID=37344 RepID=UPI000625F108|nr:uncharacterized protein LOC105691504 [Athalia rosae]
MFTRIIPFFILAWVTINGVRAFEDLEWKALGDPHAMWTILTMENPYLNIRKVFNEDEGADNIILKSMFLDILQEITPDLGLKLCDRWNYFNSVDDEWHSNSNYLCSALDELFDIDTDEPRPDVILGLRGRRCPLQPGTIEIPDFTFRRAVLEYFPANCTKLHYVASIDSADSDENVAKSLVHVSSTFVGC